MLAVKKISKNNAIKMKYWIVSMKNWSILLGRNLINTL